MKQCARCKIEKPLSEFHRRSINRDGLDIWCKSCKHEYSAGWYARNRERDSIKCSEYYQQHREEIIERQKGYYKQHKAEKKAYDAVYGPAYDREHRAEHRANQSRRRARKLANGGTHTAEDVKRQGECQKWRCWWCGKKCKRKYHVDHLIPLSRGGHNNPSNIVIACPGCNLSKNDKLPEEWAGKLL